MFCSLCGAPNEEGAVYCGNCGVTLNPDQAAGEAVEKAAAEVATEVEELEQAGEELAAGLEPETPLPPIAPEEIRAPAAPFLHNHRVLLRWCRRAAWRLPRWFWGSGLDRAALARERCGDHPRLHGPQ